MTTIFYVKLIAFFGDGTSARHAINNRPERLNQVIHQIERVGSGAMMNSKRPK